MILRDISEKDALSAEMLFLDAMQYYQREQLNRTRVHGEFVELLQRARGVISDFIARTAVELAVNRLLEDAEVPMPENMDFISRVFSSEGYVEQRSFADQVLYKILPLVQEFVPELEERILERREGLTTVVPIDFGPALEGYTENAISIMPSTADPSERASVLQSIIDQSRARKAQDLTNSDPETARRLASSIEDAGLRTTTLLAIDPGSLNEGELCI